MSTALKVSRSITVDDSGARHQGKNGYVTQIGNATFAWFSSTYSKSRINFLQRLQAGQTSYFINEYAIDHIYEQGLPLESRRRLEAHRTSKITDRIEQTGSIPLLPTILRERALATAAVTWVIEKLQQWTWIGDQQAHRRTDGDIRVESQSTKGSLFEVRVP